MKIRYVKKTRPTGKRLIELMPEQLEDLSIYFNFGNSDILFDYDDWLIFNTPEAVKNASNKKRMFRLFQENNINAIEYINLETQKELALMKLRHGKKLVLREEKSLKLIGPVFGKQKIRNSNGYVTIKENKLSEYRIIVWNNRILKTYIKLPNNYIKKFQYKINNCTFKRLCYNPFDSETTENILKSVRCLGLDLAGVDLLLNKDGEYKIIEVNSSPGMSEKTIKYLYQRMIRSRRVRELYQIHTKLKRR